MNNHNATNNNGNFNTFNIHTFLEKLLGLIKKIGADSTRKVLELYYALDNPEMPLKIKTIIYGALAYLISPIDAIPDLTPVIGFNDDIAVIATAFIAAQAYINDEVRAKVDKIIKRWFGGG